MAELTWDGSEFDITFKGDSEASSNNDGAACHGGDPTLNFDPDVTAAEGSCSGSNKPINVTLNNSASEVGAEFTVTYTLNGGGSQTLGTDTVVAAGAQNTSLSIPAQANGTVVVISWEATDNSDLDYREPVSGTTALNSITVDASDCITDPIRPLLRLFQQVVLQGQVHLLLVSQIMKAVLFIITLYKIDDVQYKIDEW